MNPSSRLDAFAFPISNPIFVIKSYGQASWQDVFLTVYAFNYVQYDAHYLSETNPTLLPLRAVVSVSIGCALVIGWLQPVYEAFVGRVFVPQWWIFLHIVSLAALLFLCFFL